MVDPAKRPDTSGKPRRDLAGFLRRHVYLLPLLAVGLWLRLTSLGKNFLYGDEAEYAIVARYLSRDPLFLAYPALEGFGAVPFVSQPPLVLYTMALSMKIFGATDFAAILPSVLFGVATVVAVYALGRRLGGPLVGYGSAALLAVLPFHIDISRKAQLDTGFAFFFVLTTFFIVAWMQARRGILAEGAAPVEAASPEAIRKQRRYAMGAGLAGAGAALSKLTGVLVVPVLVFAFLAILLVSLVRHAHGRHHPGELRETLVQGGHGAAPMAAGAFVYLALLSHLQALTDLWVKLTWQLGRVDTSRAVVQELAAFDRPWDWYFTEPRLGFVGLFGGAVVVLGLVGASYALARVARRPVLQMEHAVAPVFALLMLAFFMWSDRKEGFYLLPFAPFFALFVAQSADALRNLLRWAGIHASPRTARQVGPVAFALGVLLVAVPAYSAAAESYEDFHLGDNQEKYFGYGTRDAALWIQENDPEAAQYGTLLARFTLHWYNEQDTYHWYVDHSLIDTKVQEGHLRYVVYDDYLQLPYDREFMQTLIDRYGGEPVQTYRAGWGELTIYRLHP